MQQGTLASKRVCLDNLSLTILRKINTLQENVLLTE